MSDLVSFASQIEDRNFLTPTGFRFSVQKADKIAFFGTSCNIPSLNLGTIEQPNYLRGIPRPGDTIDFEDLIFNFLVDENLENFNQIQNWIRALGYPESLQEIYDWQNDKNLTDYNSSPNSRLNNLYSDGTLLICSNDFTPIIRVNFKDMFPYFLTNIEFNSQVSDITYLTAEVRFKYTNYEIESIVSCC